MAKPEWGRKRTCQVCGKKFYDLNKSPIICPCPEAVEFDAGISKISKNKSLSAKMGSENDKNVSEEDTNIDDIDTDINIVEDDDPLLEINKDNQDTDADIDININDDISFIDDDEINGDDVVDEDIVNKEKK
jgi:uncharacterized protein (TIGR02300 family)